nr:vegetative cell wall protein gp1-like [Camelus dromedarius]
MNTKGLGPCNRICATRAGNQLRGPGQASGLRLRAPPTLARGLHAAPAAPPTSTPSTHSTPSGSGPSPTTEATLAQHPRSFIVDSKLPKWRRLLPPRKPPPPPHRALASAASRPPPRPRPVPGAAGPASPRPASPPAAQPYLRRCPLSWRRRSRRPAEPQRTVFEKREPGRPSVHRRKGTLLSSQLSWEMRNQKTEDVLKQHPVITNQD